MRSTRRYFCSLGKGLIESGGHGLRGVSCGCLDLPRRVCCNGRSTKGIVSCACTASNAGLETLCTANAGGVLSPVNMLGAGMSGSVVCSSDAICYSGDVCIGKGLSGVLLPSKCIRIACEAVEKHLITFCSCCCAVGSRRKDTEVGVNRRCLSGEPSRKYQGTLDCCPFKGTVGG